MRSLLLSIFLFLTIASYSQEFKGGIRAGFDGSQVNGDALEGFDKLGVLFGPYVRRDFSEKFSMQLEMMFIQKGSRKPTNDFNEYYLMRLSYIEVPVLFIYNMNKKIGFHAGPSFGVLISDEESDHNGVYVETPEFKKYEVAANFGVLYLFSDHWSLDLRYSNSITTIRPYSAGYTTFFDKGQYNVVLEFSLLYTFNKAE